MSERDWRPAYVQVAEYLRDDIKAGKIGPGDALPSEPALAAQFGVTRRTVREGIDRLRAEGLVTTTRGLGTFVRRQRQHVRRDHTQRYQWEKDRARLSLEERQVTGATEHDTGLDMPDLDFRASYSTVEASPELAVVFGVPEGTALLRRDYWTSSRAENSPLNIVRSYLVRDVAAGNPELLDEGKEPWPGGTMSQLYTLGIEIDRIVDEITARPPTPDEAGLLEIEPGVSVLVLRKTSIDSTGKVAEYSEVILPGDRAEIVHTTTLERW